MYSAAVVQESLPRRREPWRWTVQGLAIRSWQPPAERIIRADPLVVTGEAAEELNANHSMLIRYLKQTGKVKKLKKWMTHMLCAKSLQSDSEIQRTLAHQVPHGNCASWAKARKKKNPKLWSVHLLLLYTTMNHFLIRLWHVTSYMTTGDDQLSAKPNLHQKEVTTVTVWWSATRLIHCSFLNPSKTMTFEKHAQQINEMHQKLQQLQPALVNRNSSILLHNNGRMHVAYQYFKSWTNWDTKFASSAIFTWPLAN